MPRPQRLRDEKRAMGTRMEAEKRDPGNEVDDMTKKSISAVNLI